MSRESYQQELSALREGVVALSETVVDRLELALSSLATGERAAARRVVDGDGEINDRYLELEQKCIDLFALQQPVASDLRFVAASFKILTDLERVADLATNLAEYALEASREVFPEVDVQALGVSAVEMVELAVEAYTEADTAACFAIDEYDDSLDQRCAEASDAVVRHLIERETAMADDDTVQRLLDDASRLLLTIRDLERVGDHAVNVAARTLYMVENDDALIY